MIEVLVNNEIGFELPESQVVQVVLSILSDHDVRRAEVSVAIVGDTTIHALNREHLRHDYPTDVLSFLLERTDDELDGEVIVSADTAAHRAPDYRWTARSELMLYLIHGCLHLVGYDDKTVEDRAAMSEQEVHYLQVAGIQPVEVRALRDREASA